MKICLDAGHGGLDPGAVGTNPRTLRESDVNLAVSLLLEQELKSLGHQVVMTRRTDVSRSLTARSKFANDRSADLFVSIHANSASNSSAEGIEVFHFEGSQEGKQAAASVLDSIMEEFPDHKNRGVKTANFHVLRETSMAAILVELEFLSNPDQLVFLEKESTHKGMAGAIARGIQGVVSTGAAPMEFDANSAMLQPVPLAAGDLPEIDCTFEPVTIKMLPSGRSPIDLPTSGRLPGESHYVTTEDGTFGSNKYPTSKDQNIQSHLKRSLKLYQDFDPNATFEQLYGSLPQFQQVWTPAEGGHIGQGSVGDFQLNNLTPEMEMWFFTMFWRASSKPAPGTRFLVSANGKQVVCCGGFETGPGGSQLLGGVTWEVHAWLGTNNSSQIKVAKLKNQLVPFGPVVCS
ncbi:MAG: N-acetylmuramoyl-L-alanine amidase [Verrucomicrobiota bacterium]